MKKAMVSDTIFEELQRRIIAGEWAPGERIPSENKLCELTGASRVSVRAAIQKLSSLGLLESRQGGGTFVCELSGEQHLNSVIPYIALSRPDQISMFEFRSIIEVEGAALAAQRATQEQIDAMHEANMRMETATEIDEITQADLDFHHLLLQASQNPILSKIFEVLEMTYFSMLRDNVSILGSSGSTYHRMITVAIETRDSELARLLMKKHLDSVIQVMVKDSETAESEDIPCVSDR